jgi:DnaK suppressor protein
VARQTSTSKSRKKTAKVVKPKAKKAAVRKKTTKKATKKITRKTAKTTARKAAAQTRKKATEVKKETTRKVKKVVRVRKKLSKAAEARINKLRTMLEQRKTEILVSIRKAREDTVEAHRRTFSEVGDLVSASLEKEMAFKYGEYGVNMLREIDTALEKLKEGSYGRCETCGKIIGVKRLEVVPSARLCINCKSKEEEGSQGKR